MATITVDSSRYTIERPSSLLWLPLVSIPTKYNKLPVLNFKLKSISSNMDNVVAIWYTLFWNSNRPTSDITLRIQWRLLTWRSSNQPRLLAGWKQKVERKHNPNLADEWSCDVEALSSPPVAPPNGGGQSRTIDFRYTKAKQLSALFRTTEGLIEVSCRLLEYDIHRNKIKAINNFCFVCILFPFSQQSSEYTLDCSVLAIAYLVVMPVKPFELN